MKKEGKHVTKNGCTRPGVGREKKSKNKKKISVEIGSRTNRPALFISVFLLQFNPFLINYLFPKYSIDAIEELLWCKFCEKTDTRSPNLTSILREKQPWCLKIFIIDVAPFKFIFFFVINSFG